MSVITIAPTGVAPRPNTDAELAAVERMVRRRVPEGAERAQVLDMLLGTPKGMTCATCDRPMRWPGQPNTRTPKVTAATRDECAGCARRRKAGRS